MEQRETIYRKDYFRRDLLARGRSFLPAFPGLPSTTDTRCFPPLQREYFPPGSSEPNTNHEHNSRYSSKDSNTRSRGSDLPRRKLLPLSRDAATSSCLSLSQNPSISRARESSR